MAEPIAEPRAVPKPLTILSRFVLPLSGLLLAILATALCRAAADVSLGLFFGGVAFATLLVPPLTAGEDTTRRRLLIPFAVTLGVCLVWLAALGDRLTFSQWLACSVSLLAYAIALGGACSFLLAIRCDAVIAAAMGALVGLLWLTWPVWLSHALLKPWGDALVAWLVPAHPLFAINAVLIQFETWDRHTLAYTRLTVLNQDVFYSLPQGVLWATLLHGAIGGIGLGAMYVISKRSRGIRVVLRAMRLQVDVPDRSRGERREHAVREYLAPHRPRNVRSRVRGRRAEGGGRGASRGVLCPCAAHHLLAGSEAFALSGASARSVDLCRVARVVARGFVGGMSRPWTSGEIISAANRRPIGPM